MLRLKKTNERLFATREEELVPRDMVGAQVKQFNEELSKLMDVSDGEDLNEAYIGKKVASPGASKGHLARIMESYTNSDDEDDGQLERANLDQITPDNSVIALPKMSPAMSYKSLQHPSQIEQPYSRLNHITSKEDNILPAIISPKHYDTAERRESSLFVYGVSDHQIPDPLNLAGKKSLRKPTLRYLAKPQPSSTTITPYKNEIPVKNAESAEWPHKKIECIDHLEASMHSPRILPSSAD